MPSLRCLWLLSAVFVTLPLIPKISAKGLPDDVVESNPKIYLRPDISWAAPGKKDCITVRSGGEKDRQQRHYQQKTTKEAFSLYKEEFQQSVLSLTKFRCLRPKSVLFQSCMPNNECVCLPRITKT